MDRPVRVRYAPSPTGYPHVGNIRTALFNWLFARHYGGKFIVRIEDTDVARKVEGAVEAILSGLRWLGLDWDEGPEAGGEYGPYFQSERLHLYHTHAGQLLEKGFAYKCYCSPERLTAMREEQVKRRQPPGYDRKCRDLSAAERQRLEASGITAVVRFKTPPGGQTVIHDLIRGDVTFDNALLDDFVLLKSDGYPTYHLANIVDDRFMKVSHVLRADEWLASTPRHKMLYDAFGWEPPLFAHLPMILGPDHSKLSKRHGATSITEYQDMGYIPEAMVNFLALLGWALDDKTEMFTREELIKYFELERISKTGAIFNIDKLNWMNGVYLRKLDIAEYTRRAIPYLEKGLPGEVIRSIDINNLQQILMLEQERAKVLSELPALVDFFFVDPPGYDVNKLLQNGKLTVETAIKALSISGQKLQEIQNFEILPLEEMLRALCIELEMKTSEYFGLMRIVSTGRTAAPPLFQTMATLGRDKCLRRINKALEKLKSSMRS